MKTIEKILTEIERQLEELGMSGSVGVGRSVLLEMRDFVKSLKKESEVDLEKEIKDYIKRVHCLAVGKEIANLAHYFYELGLNAKSDAPKIKGWLARDRNKALFFHHEKPHRYYGDTWRTDWVRHPQPELHHLRLLDDIMPNLKWEDEPIEVELIIRKKEEYV